MQRPVQAAVDEVRTRSQNGERDLAIYPQKREMILLTSRPVQLETPFSTFDRGLITPNDSFFVRWHHEDLPAIDPRAYALRVHGLVNTQLSLSLDALRTQFEAVEIAAVCECAGNSRAFFAPKVPGGQWGNGAMGNAVWRGARLKDILAKAGVATGAVQVRFGGLDKPTLTGDSPFLKSLDLDVATGNDVLIAYAMNGEPLPMLNGYPVRLVVPGYYATYWVKMLNDIEVLDRVDDNHWMRTAYRVPADPRRHEQPGAKLPTVPITRLTVRSFITSLSDGQRVQVGKRYTVSGIAFDSGFGIAKVLFSTDGGVHWTRAELGRDEGKYAFRAWTASFTPASRQQYSLQSLAVNSIGETQHTTSVWNSSGYLRNSIETVRVDAA